MHNAFSRMDNQRKMAQALTYLYEIYAGFINMVFNDFELFPGVSVGWLFIVVAVFGILINSILNIPKGIQVRRSYNGKSDSGNY